MALQPSQRRERQGAFTLVELLVVIGIIGVLLGILLPVLVGVRQRSQAAKCATNLRGLAQAWQMYAQSNKGAVCPGRMPVDANVRSVYGLGWVDAYRPRWYELLGAEAKQFANKTPGALQDDTWAISNAWFLCPARPEWANSRNYVYGYNYQFLGNARAFGVARQRGNTSRNWIKFPVRVSSIKASQTIMAADCMGTAAGKPLAQRSGYMSDGSKDTFAWVNKGWAMDPPRLTSNSDYADTQHRSPQDRSGPDPRHTGKVNVAFCDGHVELLTPREMGYVVMPDGSMVASAPGATNKLFSGTGEDDDPPRAY